jgi:hypothetical protein
MGFGRQQVIGWLYYFRRAEDPAAEAVVRLLGSEIPPEVVDQHQAVSSLMELFNAARVRPTRDACVAALESCDGSVYDGAHAPCTLRHPHTTR